MSYKVSQKSEASSFWVQTSFTGQCSILPDDLRHGSNLAPSRGSYFCSLMIISPVVVFLYLDRAGYSGTVCRGTKHADNTMNCCTGSLWVGARTHWVLCVCSTCRWGAGGTPICCTPVTGKLKLNPVPNVWAGSSCAWFCSVLFLLAVKCKVIRL